MANTSAQFVLKTLSDILEYNNGTGSVNFYMAHGGSNFGYWAGEPFPVLCRESGKQRRHVSKSSRPQICIVYRYISQAGIHDWSCLRTRGWYNKSDLDSKKASTACTSVPAEGPASLDSKMYAFAGANMAGQIYQPHITSYDYDCPISEAGAIGQPGIGGDNKFKVLIKDLLPNHCSLYALKLSRRFTSEWLMHE